MSKVPECQRRATDKWNKENITNRTAKFGPADKELLAFLDQQPNKSGYIKDLIRADMEAKKAAAAATTEE